MWKRILDFGASVSTDRKRDSGILSLRENDSEKKIGCIPDRGGLVTPSTNRAGKSEEELSGKGTKLLVKEHLPSIAMALQTQVAAVRVLLDHSLSKAAP